MRAFIAIDLPKEIVQYLIKLQRNIDVGYSDIKYSYTMDSQEYRKYLEKIVVEKRKFEVFNFFLYESILTREGPIYRKINGFQSNINYFK